MRIIFLSAAVVIAGCTPATSKSDEDRLASIIRQNGCQVSKTEAEEVLGSHGFSPDSVRAITDRWKAEGLAKTSTDPKREFLYLSPKLCRAE